VAGFSRVFLRLEVRVDPLDGRLFDTLVLGRSWLTGEGLSHLAASPTASRYL
jgi:hypothetical protein